LLVGGASYYRCASLSLGNRIVQFGIPDGLVIALPDAGPTFLILGHEDVEGGLWALLQLAPLVLLPLSIL
jgi:hypothetical protein